MKRRKKKKPAQRRVVKAAKPLIAPAARVRFLEALTEFPSVRAVCKQAGMPSRHTVRRECLRDPAFAEAVLTARTEGFHALAEETLEIADDGTNDYYDKVTEAGTLRVLDAENIQRSRLRVDTRKWLLSKVLPKVYGEKVLLGSDPENPLPSARTPADVVRDYDELTIKIRAARPAVTAPTDR